VCFKGVEEGWGVGLKPKICVTNVYIELLYNVRSFL